MIPKSLRRRPAAWLAALAIAGACTAGVDKLVGPSTEPLSPSSPSAVVLPSGTSIVISQVYGGGGNAGATYTNDFIELYNNGTNPIDLSGWSVQYASSTGTSWSVSPLSGTVAPGHYVLIQEAAGANVFTALPSPDVIPAPAIAMSATSGKVALLNTTIALGGSAPGVSPYGGATCPNNAAAANIVDFVGYGTAATCFEGTGTTTTLANATAALRNANGGSDTNDNKNDFASGAATPRNSGTPQQGAPIATIAPANPSVASGATQQFTVSATLNGAPITVTSPAWSSATPTVATIDAQSGLATAVASGSSAISVTVQTANGPATATTTLTVPSVLAPAAPGLVISQVYGGGGNSGATLKNDFIELYNGSTSPVDLSGWSVQYASSTQANWQRTPLTGTIQPGHYFLIQEGAGANGTLNLPTPDLLSGADSIAMGAGAGKIALVRTTTLLSVQCPTTDPAVGDFVGYGAANCSEGTGPTAAPSATASAQRNDGGRQDSNNNNTDFTVTGVAPRNGATDPLPPLGVLSGKILPANTATLIGTSVNFTASAQQFGAPVAINTAAWTSSNTSVATIDPASGVASALSIGSTTIGVTLNTANGVVSATTTLTVSSAPAVVTLAPATWTLKSGQTKQFTATAVDASNQPTSSTYTWQSSNTSIATVDANGVATGVGPGQATITATSANNIVGSATLTVTVGNVSIQTRTDPPLPVGFQAQLFINNGSTDKNGGAVTSSTVTWASSDPSIVSVNPNTGIVDAHVAGTVTITATATTDGVSSGTTQLTTVIGVLSPNARVGHNTDLGVPADADASNDVIIARRQYTLSYNPAHRGPNWVSWNLDATHKGGQARCNCFTADTAIVRLGYPAFDTNDWINGGVWSRGHMSPSADWADSDGDNAPTFFLSNMIPQNQIANAGAWGDFENQLRTMATGSAEIYIVAGPIFTPNRSGTGVDGFGFTNGTGHIAVPDSMWKIAIIVPDARAASGIGAPSDVQVLAVNMENSPISVGGWSNFQTTIDKIQRSTGYDFLSALPEDIQCKLEVRNCVPHAVISGAGVAGGNEGQTLAFSAATSTDADNDALTYAWLVNGTPAGTSASLNKTFADNGTYAVQLTVNDGKGGSNTSTASVVIQNVSPVVAAIGSVTIAEGGTFSTSGSFADPGTDSWTATVNYGDGSGAQPLMLNPDKSFALSHVYANNGSYQVTVQVTETDPEAGSGSTSATITVDNVAPSIAAIAGATIIRGETYTTSSSFTDPGADSWSATVDYGDGTGVSPLTLLGKTFQLTHTYQTSGVFTAGVSVFDGDAAGTGSAQVTVLSPVQAIAVLGTTVDGLPLSNGNGNALRAKLNAAVALLNSGDTAGGNAALDTFLSQVNAMVNSNRLTQAQAAALIDYVHRIQASIGN